MQVERVERQTLTDQQIAATFIAAGAKDVHVPSIVDAQASFDATLIAEPEPESPSAKLKRELGVA